MGCPGCSAKKTVKRSDLPVQVYECAKCHGIYGTCYLGDSYKLVKHHLGLKGGDVPSEEMQYFDLTMLGSKGIRRMHGFMDKRDQRVVQIG